VTDGLHARAEERSLELHRLVAARLRSEPHLLEAVRARVAGWLRDGTVSGRWAEAWRDLLARPSHELEAALTEDSQQARDLRQSSPFAGVLSPRERWDALRRLRRSAEAQ
jgi:hypothetical protein